MMFHILLEERNMDTVDISMGILLIFKMLMDSNYYRQNLDTLNFKQIYGDQKDMKGLMAQMVFG